jgi:hypothetical protein
LSSVSATGTGKTATAAGRAGAGGRLLLDLSDMVRLDHVLDPLLAGLAVRIFVLTDVVQIGDEDGRPRIALPPPARAGALLG